MNDFGDKMRRINEGYDAEIDAARHNGNGGGSFRVFNSDGSPAEPLALLCEHAGCRKKATVDCKRKWRLNDPWNTEPEALCEEHSQGRKVLRRLMAGENPGATL